VTSRRVVCEVAATGDSIRLVGALAAAAADGDMEAVFGPCRTALPDPSNTGDAIPCGACGEGTRRAVGHPRHAGRVVRISIGVAVQEEAATIYREQHAKDITPTTIDALIAGIPLDDKAAVFSLDHDFSRIAQITLYHFQLRWSPAEPAPGGQRPDTA
jgi:hypothetical protein